MQPLVDWARLAAGDDAECRYTLLAEDAEVDPPDVVAVASWERPPSAETSDVALLVRHDWQGRGLGTALFEALLDAAEARGIRRFRALVLSDNHRMLDMLERCGAIESRSGGAGVIEIVFTRPACARPPALHGPR
jgi:GNAT superfamily N-acetyltransferase